MVTAEIVISTVPRTATPSSHRSEMRCQGMARQPRPEITPIAVRTATSRGPGCPMTRSEGRVIVAPIKNSLPARRPFEDGVGGLRPGEEEALGVVAAEPL